MWNCSTNRLKWLVAAPESRAPVRSSIASPDIYSPANRRSPRIIVGAIPAGRPAPGFKLLSNPWSMKSFDFTKDWPVGFPASRERRFEAVDQSRGRAAARGAGRTFREQVLAPEKERAGDYSAAAAILTVAASGRAAGSMPRLSFAESHSMCISAISRACAAISTIASICSSVWSAIT